MLNDVMKTLGLVSSSSTRKRKYKYKLVRRGVIVSRHYTKSAGNKAKRTGDVLMPIGTKIRRKKSTVTTMRPKRRKRRTVRSKTRRY